MLRTPRISFFVSIISAALSLNAAVSRADLDAAKKTAKPAAAEAASEGQVCATLLTDAIPVKWVQKMLDEGKAADPETQRLRDIVQRVGFNNAAANNAVLRAHNTNYTLELPQGDPVDQAQSGRCWIFAGLNMIRSTMVAGGKVPPEFEFSENYLHFFGMLEKANTYLEKVIQQTLNASEKTKLSAEDLKSAFDPDMSDGGWYSYFMQLVSKYGLVPKDAMPETVSSLNTNTLNAELQRQLAQNATNILSVAVRLGKANKGKNVEAADYLKEVRETKERGMAAIWRILATHLGDPPKEFDYRVDSDPKKKGSVAVKTANVAHFTPLEFAKDFAEFDASDYVVVGTSALHPPGVYEQDNSAIGPASRGKPAYNVRFLNVDVNRLEELAATSIHGGQPIWFASDVSRDVDYGTGIMNTDLFVRDPIYNLPADEQSPTPDRAMDSFFGLASPNHAMLLTGYDQPDPNGPIVKFKVQNSWGDEVGTKGVFHLYDNWFKANVFQIVVHKKFLAPDELKAWQGEPTMLSEDDPLF